MGGVFYFGAGDDGKIEQFLGLIEALFRRSLWRGYPILWGRLENWLSGARAGFKSGTAARVLRGGKPQT